MPESNVGPGLEALYEKLVNRTDESAQHWLRAGWLRKTVDQIMWARHNAGISQAELAARIGTTQAEISKLERGQDMKLSRYIDCMIALDLAPMVPETVPLQTVLAEIRTNPRIPLTAASFTDAQEAAAPESSPAVENEADTDTRSAKPRKNKRAA